MRRPETNLTVIRHPGRAAPGAVLAANIFCNSNPWR
jgi:hypothetical protein